MVQGCGSQIINHAFIFLLLTHLLPEWLICDFSIQFQTVHRSSEEMEMWQMRISSRNTNIPPKLIYEKCGEEVIWQCSH